MGILFGYARSLFGNPERFAKELFLAYFCTLIYHYAKD